MHLQNLELGFSIFLWKFHEKLNINIHVVQMPTESAVKPNSQRLHSWFEWAKPGSELDIHTKRKNIKKKK